MYSTCDINAVVVLDDACVIANELRWTTANENTHSRDVVPHSRDIYSSDIGEGASHVKYT